MDKYALNTQYVPGAMLGNLSSCAENPVVVYKPFRQLNQPAAVLKHLGAWHYVWSIVAFVIREACLEEAEPNRPGETIERRP